MEYSYNGTVGRARDDPITKICTSHLCVLILFNVLIFVVLIFLIRHKGSDAPFLQELISYS